MRSTLRFTLAAVVTTLVLAPTRAPAAPLFGQAGEDFKMGTWAVELDAAYIHPIRFSEDKFYQAAAAAHYYFGDDVSAGVELQGYYVDQPRDDTGILGGGLLLRWHFFEQPRYSLFVDGGVSATIAEAAVPEGGTHYNYTGKGGVGATVELRDNLHLVGGARFFHISNGNLHGRDQNPSQDGIQYWLGVMFTF